MTQSSIYEILFTDRIKDRRLTRETHTYIKNYVAIEYFCLDFFTSGKRAVAFILCSLLSTHE